MHAYGGWGYDHVLVNIVPMMEDEGITDEQIETLLVKNPENWLFGQK
jgi:phosphotriesterase-related protein